MTVCPVCLEDLIDYGYDEEYKMHKKECPMCEKAFIRRGKGATKVWNIKSIYDV